jgi:hypothetical protein
MDNPFSWDYLTTVPGTDEVFGPFAIFFLLLFGLGFMLSVFLYNDGAKRYINHSLKRRMIRRGAGLTTIVFATGLFFFGIRILQINPFNFGMRIWLWLCLLAALLILGFFAYYLRTAYPSELRRYEDHRRKQQYLRAAAASAGGVRAPAIAPTRPVRRRRRR